MSQGKGMDDRRFSERRGLASEAAEITIRDDAPEDLRALVADFAYDAGLRPYGLRAVVCRVLMRRPDADNWSAYPNVDHEARELLDGCEWYEVYDVIEAIFEALHPDAAGPFNVRQTENRSDRRFADLINTFFMRRGIGWQLVDGRIEVRGPEAFEVAIQSARTQLQEAGLHTAAQEIHEALGDLARRPNPDITGAMQHAMAAAECVARTAANDQKATLGEILKHHPGLVPRPLDKGLEKMWGYASEAARHLQEGRDPSFEEAELAVFTAAGVIIYLEKKLSARSAP